MKKLILFTVGNLLLAPAVYFLWLHFSSKESINYLDLFFVYFMGIIVLILWNVALYAFSQIFEA